MAKPVTVKSDRSVPAKPVRPTRDAAKVNHREAGPGAGFPTYALAAAGGVAALVESEWLLTNGLGGFAMGTAAGVPTRRYHGLLIAATRPPVGRVMALNATADRLLVDPQGPNAATVDLSGFRFAALGDTVHPAGPSNIQSFVRDESAAWVFRSPEATITRRVHVHHGCNAVSIRYTVERAAAGNPGLPLRLTCRPLVSLRDFHGLIRREWADRFHIRGAHARGVTVERDGLSLGLEADAGKFDQAPQWWNEFLYTEDRNRGQDCIEDLFSPGEFSIDLAPGQKHVELLVRAALNEPAPGDVERDRAARASRVGAIAGHIAGPGGTVSPEIAALAAASDDFVVSKGDGAQRGVSVIAGYPWFSDWGRDTFVSLPGLLIATGRLEEAKQTLRVFAAHRRRGLIPNVFSEQTGEPEYNTVDGSLWFIQAACAYAEGGGDAEFWRTELAPACVDVILNYRRGTDHNIAMDPFDKLITAGTSATQLTWMDARRDGVTFTPRYGKAVEINALWISGLRRVAALLDGHDAQTVANLSDLAEAASRSFRKSFWNNQGAGADAGCCFDCLVPSESDSGPVTWRPDASLRPNQIFAVSLPHSPLTPDQQVAVVRTVRERLYTPRGLRTLDRGDARYKGRYEGSLFQRDGAYHNGTAWPWLLGPLAEAVMRSQNFSDASKREASGLIAPLRRTLAGQESERGGCLGQIAEIYDGDEPQRPQGCPAQAWSVAELLRVSKLAL